MLDAYAHVFACIYDYDYDYEYAYAYAYAYAGAHVRGGPNCA